MAGLSGLALYVPRPRVCLESWCGWTGADPSKIRAVVGDAFRVPARHEDAYTMAAQAVLRLMEQHEVDPARVGLLVFATESSADNAVGGPTVRGLVDRALTASGRPTLSRRVETYEVKQACLSGMNGLLSAVRFVTLEPDAVAIVVASDIAEYERGSSGEPTQGAGAVAMLVEAEARLLDIDPRRAGRSSAERGFDFRKPVRAPGGTEPGWPEARPRDFPVFAGHYSTRCYLDAVDHAFLHAVERENIDPAAALDTAALVLLHRPYQKMPESSVARLFLRGMNGAELEFLAPKVDVAAALAALDGGPDPETYARAHGVEADPSPELSDLLRAVQKLASFKRFIEHRCRLGGPVVRELGNLYAAALPAWIGAALEEAATAPGAEDWTGRTVLLAGYGSGDAALVVFARLAPGWRDAAARGRFSAALEDAVPVDKAAYEAAHDRKQPIEIDAAGEPGLAGVGTGEALGFDDRGVPRYAVLS